ncbi:MAG: class I SAM-dependent methyltransferase [Xenococcaceae cyanobacterium MO_207.B15]|nr:class I SAM-dependent methyltransferase [Xenococcaceae cyanobacterium MO_207.B15]
MSNITKKQIDAGQAVYNSLTLLIYDLWVLSISNQFIWECPSSHLLKLYNENISANHLDIGVGTGFFLDRCQFPTNKPRLFLMDLNSNCLKTASHRIKRYKPITKKVNILEPINFEERGFDSIGLNYLLHCLPGTMSTKEIIFKNIKLLLNPQGIVFGSTILSQGIKPNILANYLMKIYNKKGIFTNKEDDLETLKKIMRNNFSESLVTTVGCVALFWGKS